MSPVKSVFHILILASTLSAIASPAQKLNSRDCAASDLVSLKAEVQNNFTVPASIEAAAQPALATLVALGGQGGGVGTGFAVRISQESTSWLSAFHVTGSILDGDKLLVFLPDVPLMTMNADGASATVNYDLLVHHTTQVDPGFYSYNRQNRLAAGKGFDFSQFDDRGINFTSDQRSVVRPLELRDLDETPLLLNERIYLAGRQLGRMRTIACSYIGFDRDAFAKSNAIQIVFTCPEMQVKSNGVVSLGAISGGPLLDGQAKAFGIFQGYSYPARDPSRIRFNATPIFRHSDRTLQPFPDLKSQNGRKIRCLPCYSHNSGPDLFLNDPEKGKSSCAITYDESKRKFSFLAR